MANITLNESGVIGPRSFEHVDGNWPSQIYINVNKMDISGLDALITCCISDFFKNPILNDREFLKNEDNLHISLSKPFVLRYQFINNFLDKLASYLNRWNREPIILEMYPEYMILGNDNNTKSFLCVPIDYRSNSLKKLVEITDAILTDYNQPIYYKSPKFHVSIGVIFPYIDFHSDIIIPATVPDNVHNQSNKIVNKSITELTSLFDYDGDSSDSSSNDSCGHVNKKKRINTHSNDVLICKQDNIDGKSSNSGVPVNSVFLSISQIECKVGNRIYIFPLTLPVSNKITWTLKLDG